MFVYVPKAIKKDTHKSNYVDIHSPFYLRRDKRFSWKCL